MMLEKVWAVEKCRDGSYSITWRQHGCPENQETVETVEDVIGHYLWWLDIAEYTLVIESEDGRELLAIRSGRRDEQDVEG
jgi:hypothetical protein